MEYEAPGCFSWTPPAVTASHFCYTIDLLHAHRFLAGSHSHACCAGSLRRQKPPWPLQMARRVAAILSNRPRTWPISRAASLVSSFVAFDMLHFYTRPTYNKSRRKHELHLSRSDGSPKTFF